MKWSKKHDTIVKSGTEKSLALDTSKVLKERKKESVHITLGCCVRVWQQQKIGKGEKSGCCRAPVSDCIKCNQIGSNMKQRMNQLEYFNLYLAFFIFALINLLKCAIYIRSWFHPFHFTAIRWLPNKRILPREEGIILCNRSFIPLEHSLP